jgi:hypothetical protein
VTSITLKILAVMKDRTEPFLSTDCANKLVTGWRKSAKTVRVKAVNRTSSGFFSQLSHFSVDNLV